MSTETSDRTLSDQPTSVPGEAEGNGTGVKTAGQTHNAGQTTDEPNSTTAEGTQIPGWFQRKRDRHAKAAVGTPRRKKRKRPLVVVDAAGDEAELSWRQRLRNSIRGFSAMGYTISLLLHTIFLILLSLLFVTEIGRGEFSTLVGYTDDDELSIDDAVDTRIELAAAQPDAVDPLQLQKFDVSRNLLSERNVLSRLDSDIAAAIADVEGAKRDGLTFSVPEGGNFVTKGSFTAWTVPNDPAPGQNYLIVIEIRLPKKMRKYPLRDLSGIVMGTDNYRQMIPGRWSGYAKVKDYRTQVKFMVPGAVELVRDTIKIRSRILKESQTLEIVF